MHTGSCFCGAVRYEVLGDLGAAYYCYCSRCRKISGSAFTSNAVVSPDDFAVTSGKDMLKAFTTDDGISRSFCSVCGSSIAVSQGNQMRLRLGSLDTRLLRPPQMHIYTASKAAWVEIHDDLPQHAERPES